MAIWYVNLPTVKLVGRPLKLDNLLAILSDKVNQALVGIRMSIFASFK